MTNTAKTTSAFPKGPVIAGVAAAAVLAVIGFVVLGGSSSKATSLATLDVIDPTVSVRFVTASGFTTGSAGQDLAEGDSIRTGAEGLAKVTYFDGSLTRIGPATTYSLEQLDKTGGARKIRGKLEVGRTWHRVQKAAGGSQFEVKAGNAVAAVRGTAFAVNCLVLGVCEVAVVEGSVAVTTPKGTQLIPAGKRLEIEDDGTLGDLELASADDEWINQNKALDGQVADEGGEGGGSDGSVTTVEGDTADETTTSATGSLADGTGTTTKKASGSSSNNNTSQTLPSGGGDGTPTTKAGSATTTKGGVDGDDDNDQPSPTTSTTGSGSGGTTTTTKPPTTTTTSPDGGPGGGPGTTSQGDGGVTQTTAEPTTTSPDPTAGPPTSCPPSNPSVTVTCTATQSTGRPDAGPWQMWLLPLLGAMALAIRRTDWAD